MSGICINGGDVGIDPIGVGPAYQSDIYNIKAADERKFGIHPPHMLYVRETN